MSKIKLFAITAALFLFVTGCNVGPDYTQPDTPMPLKFAEDREGLTFSISDKELVQWWAIFNDPLLNELLERAICGSFDYQIALEKICQARAEYWRQFTYLFPDFEGDALATHYRASRSFRSALTPVAPFGSPIQDFFQIGVDAIWEIDLYGKFRRGAASYYDLLLASDAQARAVKITVLSEVATTYATIRALQKKIGIQNQFISLSEDLIQLSNDKLESGLGDASEVEGFIATLEGNRAALKVFETALRQKIYSLGTLLGQNPEELLELFQTTRPIPYAIGMVVPAGLPGDLLRRRPDIVAAERQLAANVEQIGVAIADLYPSFSLAGSSSTFASNPLQGANIGFASDHFSDLFKPQSRIWGIGTFIRWPVFDWGRRLATINVQESLAQQAYLNYQKTVVLALEEAESALIAYFNEQERLSNLHKQTEAAHKSFLYSEDLYQAGLANYLQLIQAQETWLNAVNTLTDSEQALAADIVAIYKAIGGDW